MNRLVCIEYKQLVFNTYCLYSIWNTSKILTNTDSGLSNTDQTSSKTNQYSPIQSNTQQYIVNRLVCIEYKRYIFNTDLLYSMWNTSKILTNTNSGLSGPGPIQTKTSSNTKFVLHPYWSANLDQSRRHWPGHKFQQRTLTSTGATLCYALAGAHVTICAQSTRASCTRETLWRPNRLS